MQTLVTHPRTGETVDISGLWDLIDNMSGSNSSLKDDLDDMMERIYESSRRVFNFHSPGDVESFKNDINVFLFMGDFLKSIKVS